VAVPWFSSNIAYILDDFGGSNLGNFPCFFHGFSSNVQAFSQPTHLDSVLVVVQHSTSNGGAASGAEVLSFSNEERNERPLLKINYWYSTSRKKGDI
jgi:hypothetical protein